MEPELNGKTVLVTGASRGIGAATAVAFARAGASRLILQYATNREGAEETLALVEGAGAEADLIAADLATSAGIFGFIDELKNTNAEIDILINNAGSLVRRARLLEFDDQLFDQVMNLNFKSAWFIAQAVAPYMLSKNKGVIVNVSSVAARNGGGLGAPIYAASKAAVSSITKSLAKELAPQGIRVNAVSPGVVDNHFHEVFSNKQMLDTMTAQTPAGRLGNNEEVADTILFLCSEGARFIHGQTIEINGGLFMV